MSLQKDSLMRVVESLLLSQILRCTCMTRLRFTGRVLFSRTGFLCFFSSSSCVPVSVEEEGSTRTLMHVFNRYNNDNVQKRVLQVCGCLCVRLVILGLRFSWKELHGNEAPLT